MNDQSYGENTLESLEMLDPTIASLKTRLISEITPWQRSSKLLMRSGIMLSGKLFQTISLVPHIRGSEFTLCFGEKTYPTPTRFDGSAPILKKRKANPSGGQKDGLKETLCSNRLQRLNPRFCSLMMGFPKNYLYASRQLSKLETQLTPK